MGPQLPFLTVFMVLTEAAISPAAGTEEEHYGKIFKHILIDFIIRKVGLRQIQQLAWYS